MEPTIALETLCRIILRAREFETLIPDTDPDEGSNPSDDGAIDAIEDNGENPAEEELRAFIGDLAEDEIAEVIALAMVGRGDFDATEWPDALAVHRELTEEDVNHVVPILPKSPPSQLRLSAVSYELCTVHRWRRRSVLLAFPRARVAHRRPKCVRACVCVCARARACVCVCARARACVCVWQPRCVPAARRPAAESTGARDRAIAAAETTVMGCTIE